MALTTSSLLRMLGAVEDPGAIQDEHLAVRLRIGPHWVHGGEYMSRWFRRTYRISAVIDTGRSISLVENEMPVELESEEEGLAWLAAILGKVLAEDVKPSWLLKGERLAHLLGSHLSNPMANEKRATATRVCGGIPRPYLYGGETAAERLALQNICVEEGRQPTSEERAGIRQKLRE